MGWFVLRLVLTIFFIFFMIFKRTLSDKNINWHIRTFFFFLFKRIDSMIIINHRYNQEIWSTFLSKYNQIKLPFFFSSSCQICNQKHHSNCFRIKLFYLLKNSLKLNRFRCCYSRHRYNGNLRKLDFFIFYFFYSVFCLFS